jgi:hypothetical protein
LVHTDRTAWSNKLRPFHPHQRQICLHIKKFTAACNDLGIKLEAVTPEHKEMNGICEVKWWKVHNTANFLLNTAQLGGPIFQHAHAYAIHIVNSCPAKNVTDQDGSPTTPYQYSYGRKPSLANFCVFGCPPVYFKHYEPTFCNKLITYKQHLQCVSDGIFIGFLGNSASWLVYSPEHPQRIVITRNAYFDEDFSSALAFDSKPFARAIPIWSHLDSNGLQTSDYSEPSIVHQTVSAANLGQSPSTFIEELKQPEQPIQDQDSATSLIEHQQDDDNDTDQATDNDTHLGPTPPTPQMINLTQHQRRHTPQQKEMTLCFKECAESPPSVNPFTPPC